MVIDPLFPTCPIRNILARICVPDTLCLIQLLGLKGSATYTELSQDMPDYLLSVSLRVLKEDRIIIDETNEYRLSSIGKELYPLASTLILWCYKNFLPRQQK